MKFSFVLPAYKASFLRQAIDSILAQTYTDFELIVVDDDSPDELFSVVGLYKDARIRYYRNDRNIGGKDLVAQWNHSLSFAQGDYVILASDDDVYDTEFLFWMSALIDRFPALEVYRSSLSVIDRQGSSINDEHFEKDEILTQSAFFEIYAKGRISSGIPQFVFKREALDRIGGFVNLPLAWFSDDATVLLLSAEGIAVSSKARLYFRYWGGSISGSRNSASAAKAKLAAGKAFVKFMRDAAVPAETVRLMPDKIRGITKGVIKSCNFVVAVKSLFVAAKMDGNLYPFSWRARVFSEYVILHTIGTGIARKMKMCFLSIKKSGTECMLS